MACTAELFNSENPDLDKQREMAIMHYQDREKSTFCIFPFQLTVTKRFEIILHGRARYCSRTQFTWTDSFPVGVPGI